MATERKAGIEINPRFVVDKEGKKLEVILDFETYKAILEELELEADSRALEEAMRSEIEFNKLEDVIAEFDREGLL